MKFLIIGNKQSVAGGDGSGGMGKACECWVLWSRWSGGSRRKWEARKKGALETAPKSLGEGQEGEGPSGRTLFFRHPPRGGVAPGHGMLRCEAFETQVRATHLSPLLSLPWETPGCSSDAACRARALLARVSPGRSWVQVATAFGASTSNFRGAAPFLRGLSPASHEVASRVSPGGAQ